MTDQQTDQPRQTQPKQKRKYVYTKKTGRPTKYTTEFIEREAEALREYVNAECTDDKPIPFLKDFCLTRGYPSTYITIFANNEKFHESLIALKDKAETKLVFGALKSKLNPFFAFQTLKNVAGWRDKQEQDKSGDTHHHLTIVNLKETPDQDLINLLLGRGNGKLEQTEPRSAIQN